jgi:polysaccharide export outer membrane protein
MTTIRAFLALCLTLLALPAAAQDGAYRIQPGDVLRLEVLEDESLNRELLVLPDGRVSVPLAGAVQASGRSVSQVQRAITSALAGSFALEPTVYVGVSRLAVREPALPPEKEEPLRFTVYVLGEVKSPGRVEIEPGTTVLQFFAQMGGFSNFAATRRIQLRRTDPLTHVERIYPLNWRAIEAGQSRNGLTLLADGDVIVVPQRRLFEKP